MPIICSDSFTRADDTDIGATEVGNLTWTEGGGNLSIASNRLRATSFSGSPARAIGYVDVGVDDFEAEIEIAVLGNGDPALVFRVSDASNCLMLRALTDGSVRLWNVQAGTLTAMGTGTATGVAGDGTKLRVIANGNDVTIYVDAGAGWTLIETVTTSLFNTATKVGVRSNSVTDSRWDNFYVYTLNKGLDSLLVEISPGVTNPYEDTSLTWQDVTADVRRVSTRRSLGTKTGTGWTASPGTAQIVLNNTSRTYNGDDAIMQVTGMPVRVSVNDSDYTRQYLFTGFVKPKKDAYRFDYRHNNWAETTLDCHDATGALASLQLPEVDPPAYGGSTALTMLTTIAAVHTPFFPAWQSADIDTGQTIMDNVPLGTDALSFLHALALSEGGVFYTAADGTCTFKDRMAYVNDSRLSTNQGTFNEVDYAAEGYEAQMAETYTSATVTRIGSDIVYSYEDTSGNLPPNAHPPITGMIMSSGTEATALAERIVLTANFPAFYTSLIRLKPRKNDTVLDLAAQRELLDLVTVDADHSLAEGGHYVESIGHDIDMSVPDWTCTLGLSLNSFFTNWESPPEWLELDDATDGLLDGTRRLAW